MSTDLYLYPNLANVKYIVFILSIHQIESQFRHLEEEKLKLYHFDVLQALTLQAHIIKFKSPDGRLKTLYTSSGVPDSYKDDDAVVLDFANAPLSLLTESYWSSLSIKVYEIAKFLQLSISEAATQAVEEQRRLLDSHMQKVFDDIESRAGGSMVPQSKRVPVRVVVCAANRINGKLYLGARHHDPLMNQAILSDYPRDAEGNFTAPPSQGENQGFIDQWGVYMNREEAYEVAKAAGQIGLHRPKNPGDWLCSEDLY